MKADPPTLPRRKTPGKRAENVLTAGGARQRFWFAFCDRVPEAFKALAGRPLNALCEGDREQLERELDKWERRYHLEEDDGSRWCRALAMEVLQFWLLVPEAVPTLFFSLGARRRHRPAMQPPDLSPLKLWEPEPGEPPRAFGRRLVAECKRVIGASVGRWELEAAGSPTLRKREGWGLDMLALYQCAGRSEPEVAATLTAEGHPVTVPRVSQEITKLAEFIRLVPRPRSKGGRPEL